MKKYLVILLFVLMLFSFAACTNDTNGNQNSGINTFVETYKTKANEYIEKGDTESAIEVLEEGVANTNDEGLKKLLEELKNDSTGTTSSESKEEVPVTTSEVVTTSKSEETNTEPIKEEATTESTSVSSDSQSPIVESNEPEPFYFSRYIGQWTETEDVSTTGGMYLFVGFDGGEYVSFNMTLIQSGGRRVAETNYKVLRETLEKITDNTITNTFTDSFGNTGVASIEFLDNKIICTISNLEEPYGGADWGIYNGDYVLSYHLTSAY